MRRLAVLFLTMSVFGVLGVFCSTAGASYGSAQSPSLPTTPPFEQCPAVDLDPSCGYLIDITAPGKSTILQDSEIGFYEGSDDVTVGVQNDSNTPVTSLHIGVAGTLDNLFGFDGDGLCTPGAPPVPDECPFGPSTSDPYDYWGPDAELTPASSDDGTVTFPTPLQPGQYTYFSLEAPLNGESVTAGNGNDLVKTSLSDGTNTGVHISDPTPVNVTDTATLLGAHAFEVPVGKKITYHVYSDPNCTKEILVAGHPAGGEQVVAEEGVLPPSNAVGASFESNHIYYWKASYEGDSKNEPTEGNCGEETMTFGTPPARPVASVVTTLHANGTSASSLTVAQGTAVSDLASVSAGGASAGGRVTYFVFTDPGCTAQVPGVHLGGSSSSTGAYGASTAVALPLGTYYFQAVYSGNSAIAPARSTCGSEVLTVALPCTCSSIRTFLNHFSVFGAGSTRLGMRLNVALGCTSGVGGCTGEVIVHAPEGAKFIDTAKLKRGEKAFAPTATMKIACSGPCATTTIQRVDLTWLALKTIHVKHKKKTVTKTVPIRSFLPNVRARHSKTVVIETVCNTAGGVVRARILMTIHFDKHGQVSYKLSDLNGDGRPDGKQLSEF